MTWLLLAPTLLLMQTGLVPPARAAASIPSPMGHRVIVHGIRADGDPRIIDSETAALLDEAVQTAKDAERVIVVLEEDSASAGADACDPTRTHRRARAVRTYLADHGIALSHITIDGVDEAQFPVASRSTCDGGAQTRFREPQAN